MTLLSITAHVLTLSFEQNGTTLSSLRPQPISSDYFLELQRQSLLLTIDLSIHPLPAISPLSTSSSIAWTEPIFSYGSTNTAHLLLHSYSSSIAKTENPSSHLSSSPTHIQYLSPSLPLHYNKHPTSSFLSTTSPHTTPLIFSKLSPSSLSQAHIYNTPSPNQKQHTLLLSKSIIELAKRKEEGGEERKEEEEEKGRRRRKRKEEEETCFAIVITIVGKTHLPPPHKSRMTLATSHPAYCGFSITQPY